MADAKISALTNLTAADPTNDMIPIVDVSDTPPASGNTKRISINNILSSSPTASGALTVTGLVTAGSASITGAATVGTTLGVTGVSTFAAGTALLPALTTTGDTNTGIYYPAADTFAVTTGGTERYRVDSTGNVGIGVTPSAWAASSKAIDIGAYGVSIANTAGYQATFGNNCFYDGVWKYKASSYQAALYTQNSGYHIWSVKAAGTINTAINFTDAMTLEPSGNLLVNTTSQILSGKVSLQTDGTRGYSYNDSTGGSGTKAIIFGSLGVEVGSVSVTTLATTYNTTSDYRLKESVKPLVGGLTRINSLKPSIYNWKLNGSAGEGFIAHELADVVPAAVTGKKDAVNEDGTISPQSIDMSRIVPILVAAIQELTARVQTLEAR